MPKGHYNRAAVPVREPVETPFKAAVEPEPQAEPEKRPIDTAPQNGDVVLLFNMDITHGVHGFWRRTRHFVGGRWVQNNCWSDPLTRKPLGAVWTHWRPIG